MKKIILSFLGIALIGSTGCSLNKSEKYGSILATIKFPEKKFAVKAIPQNTSLIMLQISGEGLTEKNGITIQITKDNYKHLVTVPQGKKTITAVAMDSEGTVLALGENSLNIIPARLNRAEITLSPLKTQNTLTEVIQKPCLITLSFNDYPLTKTLEESINNAGCAIVVPSMPPTLNTDSANNSSAPISQTPVSQPIQNDTELIPIPSVTPSASPLTSSYSGSNSVVSEPTPVPSDNNISSIDVNVSDGSSVPSEGTTLESPRDL